MLTIIPEIIGGMDIPRDCIDWFIPNISPCESFAVRFEITAVVLGIVIPLNIAMKGIMI